MAGTGRSAVLPATDEAVKAGRPGVGPTKRARDPANAKDLNGFVGGFAAEKKPTVQANSNKKYQKKGGNVLVSQSSPDSNGLSSQQRFGSSSPGGDLRNKARKPTKICIFYAQGQCNNGTSCTFLHKGEVSGSDNQGYEHHRGTGEGSQMQHLSDFKELQLGKVGLFQNEINITLIHAYGEDNKGLSHPLVKHSPHTPKVSHGSKIDGSLTTKPTDEVVQFPVVQEKNHGPYFMGHQISLNNNSCLDDRGATSRLRLDGGNLQFDMAKGGSPRDSLLSRSYLEMNPLKPDYRYQPFDSTICFDPRQYSKKLSAYVGATENLPCKYQEEKSSRHASYNLNCFTGFRNPSYDSSDYSLASQSLRATSHSGTLPLHRLAPDKDGSHHKDADIDKGVTSRSTLHVSSSPQSVVASPGKLSPVKDEVWITSVPFVPSFDLPDFLGSASSSKSQYEPLVDRIDPPKVESLNNLKSSNISCSISNQHGDTNAIRGRSLEKPLTCADKLARNASAKGSNEFVGLISYDRGHNSSLDDDNRVKTCERKDVVSLNDEKADFRFHLVEHVKELVKPIWKEGNLSKDAHKLIVKKSVDKIFASVEPSQRPGTKKLIATYIEASAPKIEKLVKAYVDRHRTA
ncbi:zinc finger CCCH domain-containing protein 36-like [Oryza brachyantha]|uniref:C3H1-type domain-containing protein n=1 Tax=Oryza brachyantha TaxID=4533 RepID=J3M8I7_ORYBR|nr:zinc finger CCCH domain-containing protein 36-like [Oryza brachyantha]